jgi:hypothetical protein
MARKAHADLSPTYQRRLERAGITPEMHAAGVSLQKARGHGNDEIISRFRQLGGYRHVNKDSFDAMGKPEKAWVAERYIQGFMTPNEPGESSTQESKDARNAFLGWTQVSDHEWDKEDWKKFRHDYTAKFSKE